MLVILNTLVFALIYHFDFLFLRNWIVCPDLSTGILVAVSLLLSGALCKVCFLVSSELEAHVTTRLGV